MFKKIFDLYFLFQWFFKYFKKKDTDLPIQKQCKHCYNFIDIYSIMCDKCYNI
jgi:hypothetical protein